MSGRQRNLRKRVTSEEAEEQEGPGEAGDGQRDKLSETRLLQQLRRRAIGVDASALAVGSGRGGSEEPSGPTASTAADEEPTAAAGLTDAYVRAKTQMNVNEDDPHMRKFIEDQLAERLGKKRQDDDPDDPVAQQKKLEAELYSIPAAYQNTLDGVVDSTIAGTVALLGEAALPARMRLHNVEQTEAVKRKMLMEMGVSTVLAEEQAERSAKEAGKIRRKEFVPIFGKLDPRKIKSNDTAAAEAAKREAHKFVKDPNLPKKPRR